MAGWDAANPDSEENIKNATENGTYGDWRITDGPVAYSWGGTWMGVNAAKAETASDAKKAAMHDLIYFFTLNEDFLVQYAKDSGDFVGSKTAVDTILANGGTPNPTCVRACMTEARFFGDLEECKAMAEARGGAPMAADVDTTPHVFYLPPVQA